MESTPAKNSNCNEAEVFFRLDQCESRPYSLREYAARLAWRIVEASIFRIPWPFRFRIQRSLLRLFGAKLNGHVDRTARVWHPWLLVVGRLTILSRNVEVYNLGVVRLGEQTVVSQDVYFCAGTHDHQDPTMPLLRDERAAISVGSGVWIGAGAFIGPGVTIGNNSIVAARAVVVKDVPDGVIVGGNPARIICHRNMSSDR